MRDGNGGKPRRSLNMWAFKLLVVPALGFALVMAAIQAAVPYVEAGIGWLEAHRFTVVVCVAILALLFVVPRMRGARAGGRGLDRQYARMENERRRIEVEEWRRARHMPYHPGRDRGGFAGWLGRRLLHLEFPVSVTEERTPWWRQPPDEDVDVDDDQAVEEEPVEEPEPEPVRPAPRYEVGEAKAILTGVFKGRAKKNAPPKPGPNPPAEAEGVPPYYLPIYGDPAMGHGRDCGCDQCKQVRKAWAGQDKASSNGHGPRKQN